MAEPPYERLSGESLGAFGLPECTLWTRRVNKVREGPAELSAAFLTSQLAQVDELLRETPQDRVLTELKTNVVERLSRARAREAEIAVEDPLKSSSDLMALSPTELQSWHKVFKRFDRQRVGVVSLQDIFSEVSEHPTAYFVHLFQMLGAVDADTGLIEFGGFVRAVSSVCFFGKEEVLK
jgi:hypothetical protein